MNFFQRISAAVKVALGDFPRSFFSGLMSGGGYTRRAGVQQDPYGNLLGWVYFAIDKVAQRVANIDLELYELVKNGDVEQIFDHELLSILYRANPYMTKTDLWYITVFYLRIWGAAPWYIETAGRKVINIWPMRPDLLRMVQDKSGTVTGYEYRVGQDAESFDVKEVIYIRKPAPDNPMRGFSALFSAGLEIDADFAAAIWNKYVLENSAEPGGVLTTDNELKQDTIKKVRELWYSRYGGPTNAGRVAILQKGLKYQAISQTQKELDFIESRKFSRDTILTLLGVPKALVIADDVNRANAETAERVFAKETIAPLMQLVVDQLNEFFVIKFGDNLWLDFKNPSGVDSEMQRLENQAAINNWKTINEVREEYNLAPLEGGDVLYMQFSLAPMVGEGTAPPQDQQPVKQLTKEFALKQGSYLNTKKLRIKQSILARTYNKRNVLQIVQKRIKEKVAQVLTGNRIKLKGVKVLNAEGDDPSLPEAVKHDRRTYLKKLPIKTTSFQKMMKKYFDRQEQIVLDNLQKYGEPKSQNIEIKSWVDKILFDRKKQIGTLVAASTPIYEDNVGEGAADIALLLGVDAVDIGASPKVIEFLQNKPLKFAEQINDTTLQALRDTLSEGAGSGESLGQLGDRISEVFGEARGFRTETIARTEVGSALNFGRNEEMLQQGVEQKQWLAIFSNTREAHAAAHGQIVSIDESFTVMNEQLAYPQDPSGSADNIINCQCSVSPYIAP